MTRTYGSARLVDQTWEITAEPQVIMRLRRVFAGVSRYQVGAISLSHTPEHCCDLRWFCQRYPLEVTPERALMRGAKQHEEHVTRLTDLLAPHHLPPTFTLTSPLRPYQAVATEMYLVGHGLLIGDELGLGKTVEAIASFTDPTTLPAVVVCQPHLIDQWCAAIARFTPTLWVHELRTMTPTALPTRDGKGPDIVVTSYRRLHGWAEVIGNYCHSAIFEEVHELRCHDSAKYKAAQYVSQRMQRRLGLSGTPILNYGGEMFYILDILKPGCLGAHEEFVREWCHTSAGKIIIKNPEVFGAYLREQGLYIRRTRKEVGRELPPITRIIQSVDSDPSALEAIAGVVGDLARILLRQTQSTRQERFEAGGQLDWRLRQATGLGKAPAVAAFTQMIVESGEPVVLAGWHRAVFAIWEERLTAAGIRVGWYTGSETPAAKAETKRQFLAGDIDVILISLRSGVGLDGLQERGCVVVHGELDWSPAIHEQLDGRLDRDGQAHPVVAYYLVSESGSDPVIAEVNGVKRDQLDGIRNPQRSLFEPRAVHDTGHIKRLAHDWLARESQAQRKQA